MQRAHIFDTPKQTGKSVEFFNTRRAEVTMDGIYIFLFKNFLATERNVSPFRGYKQMSSEVSKTGYGVSRGIFQNTKKENPSSGDVIFYNKKDLLEKFFWCFKRNFYNFNY